MTSLPLHLLPPHIKLQILSKLQVTPVEPAGASLSPSPSTALPFSTPSSLPSDLFTSPPLFPLSALSPPPTLPVPFTVSSLTQLHTDGFCIIDDFLSSPSLAFPSSSPSALSSEISHLLSSSAFHPGSMSAAHTWTESSLRGDLVFWIPTSTNNPSLPPSLGAVLSLLSSSIRSLSSSLPTFPSIPTSSQLAVYPPSGRYVRHRDTKKGGPQRRLTAILYLNEGWEEEWGGHLRLWVKRRGVGKEEIEETAVDVSPVYGRMLLFASEEMEHEVLPATHQRIALTTWFN